MITWTFEPTNSEQAALLGQFLPQYMRAGELHIAGEPEQVKAVVETAAVAQETAAAAPKRTRAARSSAATSAESTEKSTSAPVTEQSTSAPASETEGNGAAASTPAATTEATTSPASSSASVSLEQVRAKLASLSQAGKAADVKALIAEFGAAKLTDIPAEKYGDLLQKAEAIA